MVQLINVSKYYPGGITALRDLSLEIPRGAIRIVAGRSGAGKSTLLRLISGLERPSRGNVLVGQHNLATLRHRHIPLFRRAIGFVYQDHRLLQDATVFDNVALPLVIAGWNPRDLKRRVHAALARLELVAKEHCYPAMLSGGEQQRVGIARAVVHHPKLLLADEPTGNLDPGLALETLRLFERCSEAGMTVLIATHNLELIRKFKQEVIFLVAGRRLGTNQEGARSS